MGLDSVEIVMEIEDELGIRLPDEAMHDISTVGDLVAYIANLE